MTRLLGIVVGLGLGLGCAGDDTVLGSGGTDSETGPPDFDPPDPECGNGYLDPDEQCDDANLIDGDGCDSLCQIPCGMLWQTTSPSPAIDILPVVVDVAVGPSGEIVVAGSLAGQTAELDDDVWLAAWTSDGAPLWSGSYDLVEGLDDTPAGVAIGTDGAVYMSATVEAADGTDIWVGRVDAGGAGGVVGWSTIFDSPIVGSKDVASGIAVTPSGNPIVAGHQRTGDGDTDLRLAELTADTGVELWSTTWSGVVAANGFSLDVGGPIAIADDGTIWATAVEYVAFDTFDAHVLAFDPSGALLGDWAPLAGGLSHEHVPRGIAVQADGSVYVATARLGPGASFWLHRLDPSEGGATAEIAWVREMPSFVDGGEAWAVAGVAAAPDGNVLVGGTLLRDEQQDVWNEAWLHRLDPAGDPLCTSRHAGEGATILTPNLLVQAIAATPTGELIAAGWLADVENANAFWVGAFRGP